MEKDEEPKSVQSTEEKNVNSLPTKRELEGENVDDSSQWMMNGSDVGLVPYKRNRKQPPRYSSLSFKGDEKEVISPTSLEGRAERAERRRNESMKIKPKYTEEEMRLNPSLTSNDLPNNFYTISEGTEWPELMAVQPGTIKPVPIEQKEVKKKGFNSRNNQPLFEEEGELNGKEEETKIPLAEYENTATQPELETDIVLCDEDFEGLTPQELNKPSEIVIRNFQNYFIKREKGKKKKTSKEREEKYKKEAEKHAKDLIDHQWKWTEGTFINCDLRYFSLKSLNYDFDVVLIDPPWRIKGTETSSNERTMFSNNIFQLSYQTLGNHEILDIDVGCLSTSGFCFLWAINGQIPLAFECLSRWGYTYVDKIVWVKKTVNENMSVTQGYYLLHTTETCLIGVKADAGRNIEFVSKVSNDVLFSKVGKNSQKPQELYELIEKMVPGGRKIELFARNHNIRRGWLSIGNQLGEYFDWNHDAISCDYCSTDIKVGSPRFKHKEEKNKDICEACLISKGEKPEEFFRLENSVNEMVFHEWFKCDCCDIEPLWGIRFHCEDCDDLDICEECYDNKKFREPGMAKKHQEDHKWSPIEYPERAGGFEVHQVRCQGCLTCPIIGNRFYCLECKQFNLCQKCFFLQKEPKNHKSDHQIEMILEDDMSHDVKCDICQVRSIPGARYKCKSCFNFNICEKCYISKAPLPLAVVGHRPFHKFDKLNGQFYDDDDDVPTRKQKNKKRTST
eukprot:TRINITY_DN2941_c0_g1_i1.p1 TRINITY_DN2941_c0_g1~~TRINITY_DN2941_c0_g1_i1.p1  ORF type:complete len:733 (-),score=238.28 TRINITY_DN2941_c0_g1_i1:169-2367(-)